MKNGTLRRDLGKGTIIVKNEADTLTATDSQPQLIYDENYKLIATEPYVIFL